MRTLNSLAFAIGLMASAWAADYCSLMVKVQDPRGNGVDARVSVEEHDGRRIEKESKVGEVRFCDLGITPVTISVGHPACNQVVVRNVPLRWGEITTVSVVYDREPCLIDTPPVAACQFLFRFVDRQHNSIGGATLKVQTPREDVQHADGFGRLFIRIAAGQQLTGVAAMKGYAPLELMIPCVSENQKLDRYVVLERLNQ